MSKRLLLLVGLATASIGLAACGSGAGDTNAPAADAQSISVTATDTACTLSADEASSGSVSFAVKNDGSQVTEVYVYGGNDFKTVVAEVENIGPGVTRDMEADLAGGTYEIACKPGQTGDGIRATLTVSGEAAAESESKGAIEVELGIDATDHLTGLDSMNLAQGERFEFKVTNSATDKRVFEVKRPDGSVAGEIEIEPAAEGELYIDIDATGDWKFIVEGGAEETEQEVAVS